MFKTYIIALAPVIEFVYFYLYLTTTMKGGRIIIMISLVRCFDA